MLERTRRRCPTCSSPASAAARTRSACSTRSSTTPACAWSASRRAGARRGRASTRHASWRRRPAQAGATGAGVGVLHGTRTLPAAGRGGQRAADALGLGRPRLPGGRARSTRSCTTKGASSTRRVRDDEALAAFHVLGADRGHPARARVRARARLGAARARRRCAAARCSSTSPAAATRTWTSSSSRRKLRAERDSLPRSEGGSGGAAQHPPEREAASGAGFTPAQRGGVWGERRSTPQNEKLRAERDSLPRSEGGSAGSGAAPPRTRSCERSGIHSRAARGGLGGAAQHPPGQDR